MPSWFPWQPHPPEGTTLTQWLIVLIPGFLLAALVYNKVMRSMVGPHLVSRRESIAEAAEQVETTLNETQELLRDYRQRLENIEDEAEARMAEAVSEAGDLREDILREARATCDGIVRRGREEVERERAKERARVRSEYVESVIRAASHAAAGSVGGPHQDRLVDDFIGGLGRRS
jgi:F-type H+-transporting ATPase subunit b